MHEGLSLGTVKYKVTNNSLVPDVSVLSFYMYVSLKM